jgi:DNA-binding transcriptional MocR family regulator
MNKQRTANSDFLYERVADRITPFIDRGTLKPGDRLPSIRKLSTQMEVSISTVLQAYVALERKEVIEAKPQSGFYVTTHYRLPPEPRRSNPSSVIMRVGVSELVSQFVQSVQDPEIMQFGLSTPSPDLLPIKRLNRVLTMVARRNGPHGVSYDFPPGCVALRHEIAKRSLDLACALSPDDIVTTTGTMEALNLCLRAVAKPGDVIAIESPTFYGTLQAIESLGMKAVEIATDPRNGIDLDALESAIKRKRVKACLLIPTFHNPLGSCMPDRNKKDLVAMLARRQIPLIEDDIYGDLCFGPTRPKTAKTYDKEGLVLLCSSFSKTLAPGYRVGWTAPGKFKAQVESLKFMNTFASATLPQLAIAEFLHSGGYERYLRKIRRALAGRVQQMSHAISRYFPDGTRLTRPLGGYVLWVELPRSVDSFELYRNALRQRIMIIPGPIFSANRKYRNFIRLSCSQPWSDRVEHAVRALGSLIGKAISR